MENKVYKKPVFNPTIEYGFLADGQGAIGVWGYVGLTEWSQSYG